MSLVAYASSDSEEEQEDDASTSNVVDSAPKKSRETVKITIPSLQEFKEEDAKSQPKIFKAKSGSGLFSILPPPKHSTTTVSFKPYIFTKKKVSKPSTPRKDGVPKDTPIQNPFPGPSTESDPEDESSAPVVDYFSFGETSTKCEVPQIESSLFSSLPKPAQSMEVSSSGQITDVYAASSSAQELPAYSNASDEMGSSFEQQSWDENNSAGPAQASFFNDEGFKKIKGRRDTENIDIIDINAGDQLTGKDQWLMKNLTEETAQKPSKKRHGMPTQQQKRKHQITYLAFQAKERELDLKNQWSLNSLTRRETQAKYGF